MNRRAFLMVVVILTGAGGYWAYEAYQEHQRMQVWESLLNGESCDACAARKVGIAKKQEERNATEAAASGFAPAAQPEQGQ